MSQSNVAAISAATSSTDSAADNPLKKAKTNVKKNKKFNSILSSLTHSKSSNDVNKSSSTTAATTADNTHPPPVPVPEPAADKAMTSERSQRSSTTKLIKSISNMNIKQHQQTQQYEADYDRTKKNQIRLQYENMPPPGTSTSSTEPSHPHSNHHHYKLRFPSFKKLRNKFSVKKSHSTTSNLADLSKLKETSSANSAVSKMKNSFTIDHGIDIIDKKLADGEYDATTGVANEYYLVNGTGFKDYPHHHPTSGGDSGGFSAIQEEQVIIEANEKSTDDYEMSNGGGCGEEEDYLSVNGAGGSGHHQASGNYENCSPSPYLPTGGHQMQPSSNANSKKSYLNSNGTSSSTLTNNELTPKSTSSPAGNKDLASVGKNKSSTTSKSSTNTGSGGISGLLSSLSSSFSLSAGHNGTAGQVKLRSKPKSASKIDYQKRISLPASIVNHQQQIMASEVDASNTDIYENDLNERDEYYDEPTVTSSETGKKIHFQDKSNIQPASTGVGSFVKKSSTATNGISHRSMPSAANNRLNFKNAKMAAQLPSYQSLSSMIKTSESHMSHLGMKPLNRNSRRASMSELGYGKIESYNKLDKLGEGTYATVFKGQSTINNSYVALKEIRLEHEEGAPCTAIREVSLLRQLKHANIVTLHDIIYTDKSLTLVFEYLEKDLKQYMDDCNNIMSLKNVKIFLFQLLRGLAYCHAKQILHRDLKPQNLLINQKGELKLADFGLARAKSIPTKTYSNEVVTLWYRPPDVLLGSTDYSTHIDMWGVGCIFYEMACGKPLFPGTRVEDELYLIFKTLGSPTEDTLPGVSTNPEYQALNLPRFAAYDPANLAVIAPRLDADGLALLGSYLKYNPKLRASAAESIRHKFFSSFPEEVYKLENNQSIFEVPNITLTRDPGIRLNNAGPGVRNSSSNFYKF